LGKAVQVQQTKSQWPLSRQQSQLGENPPVAGNGIIAGHLAAKTAMPAINEHFTASVRDLASEGNGIVEHPNGQVFFVPGVWKGETGEFRITGFKKRFGFAELVRLLEPAAERIEPACKHQGFGAGHCGGCPWQFVSYDAQLEVKESRVRRTLARLGIDKAIKAILPSPQVFGYRNRAQFKSDGNILGYVAQGSKTIAAISDCPILSDHNRETLASLLASLPNRQFRPPQKGSWTTIDIDEDIGYNDVSVNRRRPFRQANSAQNERMRAWLSQCVADMDKGAPVLELFAGSGNFTQVLSLAGFEQILAVEGVREAVDNLNHRALSGVTTAIADLFSENSVRSLATTARATKVLVLDPPRDGFRHSDVLLQCCPQLSHILYISCDLATFSRDLQVFLEGGFTAQEVQPLDQFPHTPHVEILAWLSRPAKS